MIKKYILGSINIYIYLISTILYIVGIYTISLYPTTKQISIIIISIILFIISYICYINKKNIIYNTGIIFTIILNITTIYNINNLNTNYEYLNNIITKEYTYNTYNIYTKKNNIKYDNLLSLENKKIGTLKSNSTNTCSYLKNQINNECISYKSVEELEKAFINSEIQAIIMEEKTYNKLSTSLYIKKATRSIYKTQIKDTNTSI